MSNVVDMFEEPTPKPKNNNVKKDTTPFKESILNESKLSLREIVKPGSGIKPATLKVSVIKNNPRINVFTNVEGDVNGGYISAPMDGNTFYMLLEILELVIESESDTKYEVGNMSAKDGEKFKLSSTIVGKKKDGVIYISVISEGRPVKVFDFLTTEWHYLVDKDGIAIEKSTASKLFAKGWLKLCSRLVASVMSDNYEKVVFDKPKEI